MVFFRVFYSPDYFGPVFGLGILFALCVGVTVVCAPENKLTNN
jgi:hypothetical protein